MFSRHAREFDAKTYFCRLDASSCLPPLANLSEYHSACLNLRVHTRRLSYSHGFFWRHLCAGAELATASEAVWWTMPMHCTVVQPILLSILQYIWRVFVFEILDSTCPKIHAGAGI